MTAKAQILAAADGTRSVREIAALAGCSEGHVYAVVQEAGLPTRPASVKAAVIALADGRRTAPEIARAIGADRNYVRMVAKEMGLPVPRAVEPLADDFDEQLRRLASPRRTIRSMATRLRVSYPAVQRRLVRLGLPFKQCRRGRPRKEVTRA